MHFPEGIWLGASYDPSIGEYVWEDSQNSLVYAKWSSGQPDNPVWEPFVHMWSGWIYNGGQWNNISPDGWKSQTTVCEVLFSCNS
jgi:hypothetical protein